MNLKLRIAQLEKALDQEMAGLVVNGGRAHRVGRDELLDCLLDAMHGKEHPLLKIVRGANTDDGNSKIVSLIHTFDTDEHRQFMASTGGRAADAL